MLTWCVGSVLFGTTAGLIALESGEVDGVVFLTELGLTSIPMVAVGVVAGIVGYPFGLVWTWRAQPPAGQKMYEDRLIQDPTPAS